MKRLIKRFTSSIHVTWILIIITILSYFTNARTTFTDFLIKLGVSNHTVIDIILIVFLALIFSVILVVYEYLKSKYTNSYLLNYENINTIYFSPDGSGERIVDFQQIRANAKKTIYVMGVGMTYFSSDLSFLRKLLENGMKVRLLIQDPAIFNCHKKDRSLDLLNVNETHFDEYFSRIGYCSDISSSKKRLYEFIKNRKESKDDNGSIELRSYPYLLPLNYTMADEKENGAVLLEFIIPFSDHRMRTKIVKSDNKEMYDFIVKDLEAIWFRSIEVITDEVITDEVIADK